MIDTQLLQKFIFGFYGYGNYAAKYWFIGMEEHVGEKEDSEELETKFDAKLKLWKARGYKELEDLVDYLTDLGNTRFNEPVALVPTWSKIIQVLYGIEGQDPSIAQVKEYQKSKLAREKPGESCLIELLPLPSRNINDWPTAYAKYSTTLQFLVSRHEYKKHVRSKRIAFLKRKIEECRPKAVVFYGVGFQEHYEEIAGVGFQPTRDGILKGKNRHTFFAIAKHPVAHGVTNAYFNQIGRMIASNTA